MIPAAPVIALLGLTLALLAFCALAPYLQRVKKPTATLVAAILTMLWAADKTGVIWTFEMGIADAGSTYDAAEGVLEARWTFPSALANYEFVWKYCPEGSHEWFDLPTGKVGDGYARAIIERGLELVHIVCYARYVAPPMVVTNGVYHLSGVMRTMDGAQKYVTPGIVIKIDDKTLTPTNSPGDLK
jgi:hypothetical protein